MKDLVVNETQPIPDAFFDTPTSLSVSLTQKKYVNATINVQIIFTRMLKFNGSHFLD